MGRYNKIYREIYNERSREIWGDVGDVGGYNEI